MKKLNFLLHNALFPPETFQNLLYLYCKYQFFDLAQDLMGENPKFCDTLLEKDDYNFLKTLVTTQVCQHDPNAYAQATKDALQSY